MGEEQLTVEDVKTKSIGELYKKVKLSAELIKDIQNIGNNDFEKLVKEKYKLSDDLDQEDENLNRVKDIYYGIIDILKKYLDLKEEYYSLISLWIIGTYFHDRFYTYPYLFINAMKGSGKTRLLKLISILSKEGQMLNSLTEAVLFRTKGTLCIDEFEGITRNGSENLRELLNSAYKKGTKVKRLRKAKTPEGEQQVVEEFDVFRPIIIANIWGMESVLGDRCIPLILEKSSRGDVIKLIESFECDDLINNVTKFMREVTFSDVTLHHKVYSEWNDFIGYKHHTSHTYNITKHHNLFETIYESNIDGRHLELSLPLFVIAGNLGEEILKNAITTLLEIIKVKKEDEFLENRDISFIDFVSQFADNNTFISIKQLTRDFRSFLQSEEPWMNEKWIGRALKRLVLIKEKKHSHNGSYIVLNVIKAQERIKMFK